MNNVHPNRMFLLGEDSAPFSLHQSEYSDVPSDESERERGEELALDPS